MITALALICLIFPAAYAGSGFNVKFNKTGEKGKTTYIDVPQNVTAAIASNWVLATRPEGPEEYSSLIMYCPPDKYLVCVLFDNTEYVAGMQISVDQEKIYNVTFDMPTQGFVNWTTSVNGVTKNYWALPAYFVSAESLKENATTRIASRNSSVLVQGTDVYVTGFNGKLRNIALYDYVDANKIYVQENCYPGMGGHLYYNVTKNQECAADKVSPWVILEHENVFIGLSFQIFAQIEDSELNWLEYYGGEKFLRAILREGADCIFELGNSPGLTVLHIFFIDYADTIVCSS